jgi:hypothetical protein
LKGLADLKESDFSSRVKVLRGELDRMQSNISGKFEDRIANLEAT